VSNITDLLDICGQKEKKKKNHNPQRAQNGLISMGSFRDVKFKLSSFFLYFLLSTKCSGITHNYWLLSVIMIVISELTRGQLLITASRPVRSRAP
jgi:hypothetical protein